MPHYPPPPKGNPKPPAAEAGRAETKKDRVRAGKQSAGHKEWQRKADIRIEKTKKEIAKLKEQNAKLKEQNAKRAKEAKEAKVAKKLADAEWNKANPTRRERTGLSQKSLLRIDRKARLKAKEEATRRKNRGLPQLKRPGPLKEGEAEA